MHASFAYRLLLAGALATAAAVPAIAAPTVKKPAPYATPADSNGPVSLVEDTDGMKIDWTNGRLTISGIGVPGDRGPMQYRKALSSRAAIADAYRRLANGLELVRVDTNTRVKDLAVTDDALRTRLNDFVKSAKVLETNYWPDGSAEIVLGVDLKGSHGLTSLLASTPATAASAAPEASGTQVVTSPLPLRATYSSIIVDASGLGAQPALLPNLRDSQGKVIDLAGDTGHPAVKYLQAGAELDQAAGVNPLKVHAQRSQGALHVDLVLDPKSSDALKQALLDKKLGADTPVIVEM
jgi:hypothetical protein